MSLSVEVSFYLVLPLLCAAGAPAAGAGAGAVDRGRRGGQLGLGLAIAAVYRPGRGQPAELAAGVASWFAAGMLLAEWTVGPAGLATDWPDAGS